MCHEILHWRRVEWSVLDLKVRSVLRGGFLFCCSQLPPAALSSRSVLREQCLLLVRRENSCLLGILNAAMISEPSWSVAFWAALVGVVYAAVKLGIFSSFVRTQRTDLMFGIINSGEIIANTKPRSEVNSKAQDFLHA